MKPKAVTLALSCLIAAGCGLRDDPRRHSEVGREVLIMVSGVAGFDDRPIRGLVAVTDHGRSPLDYEFIPNGTRARIIDDHPDASDDPWSRVDILVTEGKCQGQITTSPRAWLLPTPP